MALIECPECDHSVSDGAPSCPHCGYALQAFLQRQKEQQEERRKSIVAFRKACAVVLALFVLLAGLSFNSPELGLLGSGLAVMLAFIGIVRPFRSSWLPTPLFSGVVFCAAAFWLVISFQERQYQKELAATRELTAKNEARLQGLRTSDPSAYLAELKSAADPRWETEYEALDKPGYQLFVHERSEAARKAEIAKLVDELKTVPSTDIDRMLTLYVRLTTLDPMNPAYKLTRDTLAKQGAEAARNDPWPAVAKQRQRQAEQRQQQGERVTKGTHVGCKQFEVKDKLTNLGVSGDKDAFQKFALAAVLAGECTIFDPGTTVYVEDSKLFRGLWCLRRKGEVSCFWTAMEAASGQ
jgi:zinc ribbon protein